MSDRMNVVEQAREFAVEFLEKRLPRWIAYHGIPHTVETAAACAEIAAGCGLDGTQTEIVLIAAWFHDTGYADAAQGHEERSVAIAGAFLRGLGYPAAKISMVEGCIMATKMPQRPGNILEQILCDADMIYCGREEFFEWDDLLREEIEGRDGIVVDPAAWLRRSLEFLERQEFHTEYCRTSLEEGRRRNIRTLKTRLGMTP